MMPWYVTQFTFDPMVIPVAVALSIVGIGVMCVLASYTRDKSR